MLQLLASKSNVSHSPARHPVRCLVLVPTRELAAQVHVLAVGAHALLHLGRELARGHEDQTANRMARGRVARVRFRSEELQHRQSEAGGLAGAGLGGAEEVATCEDYGNGLRLDGGRYTVTLLGDCAEQLGREPEILE